MTKNELLPPELLERIPARYFTLSQLINVKLFGVIGVERDLWLKECNFGE